MCNFYLNSNHVHCLPNIMCCVVFARSKFILTTFPLAFPITPIYPVVAVLQSSKCRNQFREGYRQFEEVVIAAYMPRFQQARTGAVYKNLEGKKGAVYNLKDVSRVISEIGDSSLSSNGNGGEKIHVGRVVDRHGHHHSSTPHTPPQQQDGSRTPPHGNPHKHVHKPHHEHHSTKA